MKDYDTWVCHFHLNKRGTPVTVYKMNDGTFEVWHGKRTYKHLTKHNAMAKLGSILAKANTIKL